MTETTSQFTSTALIAAAVDILESAGFKPVSTSPQDKWAATAVRLFEDAYSIVCVAVFETWAELSVRWTEDQASLVSLISRYFVRTDAKSWDGYLVLLTPSILPADKRPLAVSIQRNTLHVRKLFSDGSDLRTISDVHRALLPLLALEEGDVLETRDMLDSLQALLIDHGIDKTAAQVALAAFREQRPVIEQLHDLITTPRRHES